MTTTDEDGYNGWANWETWNVALWVGNDEGLYETAKECKGRKDNCGNAWAYGAFAKMMQEMHEATHGVESPQRSTACTPDGVAWNDSGLDVEALASMIEEL